MKDSSLGLILSIYEVPDRKRRANRDGEMRQMRSSSSVEVR